MIHPRCVPSSSSSPLSSRGRQLAPVVLVSHNNGEFGQETKRQIHLVVALLLDRWSSWICGSGTYAFRTGTIEAMSGRKMQLRDWMVPTRGTEDEGSVLVLVVIGLTKTEGSTLIWLLSHAPTTTTTTASKESCNTQ
jgi:hypothetical protein